MTCGVYKLESPSGKFYIGSSVNIEKRVKDHARMAMQGAHYNDTLNSAYRKYGRLAASIVVVCEPGERIAHEQACIDSLRPAYNRSARAGTTEHTAESREKIAASKRGKPRSEETKAKCRLANLGRKASDEAKAKISAAGKGRKKTVEHCAKIAAAHVGRKRSGLWKLPPRSAEHCAKIRAAHIGLHPSEAARLKMAASQTGRKHSAETKAKMAASRKRSWQNEEYRAKVLAAVTGVERSPEAKANIAAANRRRAYPA